MTPTPYAKLPDMAFWRRGIASVPTEDVDPVGTFGLKIDRGTKVATAGSCFAQHIARHLNTSGYNHLIAEPGHPILPESVRTENGYGLFSCRYGNIYTARQLLQLFERAYGRFVPGEDLWFNGEAVVDPFRPRVQRGGFISEAEMRRDREQHLAAVRRMFETLDVLVFTLGLTESWRSRGDGAVFPLCPGVDGGEFDPDRHEFYNQPFEEVISDLTDFWAAIRSLNPRAQLVLTVSPVPLVATAQPGEHVLSATTYSKSVLRVAAEVIRHRFDDVHYFPAFEIVTGNYSRGRYYAADLRNVVEPGVEHVMRTFMRHATDGLVASGHTASPAISDYLELGEQLVEVECDEVALDRG